MPKSATLIIFTGLPASGKTSLSRYTAAELQLPLLAKDDIKEIMFDQIGWSDREWSAKVASATFTIMDYIIAQQIRAGHPLVLDANFSPSLSNAKFQAWQAAHSCKVVQIVCQADLNELAHRFHERLQTDRHPGHADSGTFESFRQALAERKERGEDRPLDLKGHVITVDTTNFDDIDRSELIRQLKQHLS